MISQKIKACQLCPYLEYGFNNTKELGFGKLNRIMFIGQSPAITSNKSAGNSKFDLFFNALLAKVNISPEDYYFTNLVKTSIPKNELLTSEIVRHCKNHIIEEILEVRPKVIVLLGKIAREAFDVKWNLTAKKMTFKAGEKEFRIMVYAVAHPAYLHYRPEEEEKYLKTLKKIFKYYQPLLI